MMKFNEKCKEAVLQGKRVFRKKHDEISVTRGAYVCRALLTGIFEDSGEYIVVFPDTKSFRPIQDRELNQYADWKIS